MHPSNRSVTPKAKLCFHTYEQCHNSNADFFCGRLNSKQRFSPTFDKFAPIKLFLILWFTTMQEDDKYLAKTNDQLQFKLSKYSFNTLSFPIYHTLLTLACISYIFEDSLRHKIITCVKSPVNVELHNEARAWPEDMIGVGEELVTLLVAVCPNVDVNVQNIW